MIEELCWRDLASTYILCVPFYYMMIYWRPTTELLSLMVVMLEGFGFNLCVVPFLNICVLNLTSGGQEQRMLGVVRVGLGGVVVRFLHFTDFSQNTKRT